MGVLPVPFVEKIAKSLQDEEVDVYLLSLYSLNSKDLEFFSPKDRQRIKKIFNVLLKDTKRHAEILKLIINLGTR